jgi:hypothetical protein
MLRRVFPLFVAIVLLAPALAAPAHAQATKKGAQPAADSAAAATPAPPLPDGPALNILIRRTLLTLNDANLSGNYTVLRDLSAPGFQTANDAPKLATIFAKLRNSKMDFAPIVYFDPKLVRPPEITKAGLLRLSGFIPTRPQQVNFDMLFQQVSGRWRLFGIAVNTSPAKDAVAAPAAPDPAGSQSASNADAKKKGRK